MPSPTSKKRTVANELEARIRSGRYSLTSKMPTVRDLEREFEVSRIVANQALQLLADRGLIRVERGVGSYVVDVLPDATGTVTLESLQALIVERFDQIDANLRDLRDRDSSV